MHKRIVQLVRIVVSISCLLSTPAGRRPIADTQVGWPVAPVTLSVCLSVLSKKNHLSYQDQTRYTRNLWQDLGIR